MLKITIPSGELWDEKKREFVYPKEHTLQLEHSLVSLSKWESKWRRPFISDNKMTPEETLDYIKCMTITQNVPEEVYNNITSSIVDQILEYIDAPMTATWFSEEKIKPHSKEIVTAEVIYYWMISHNIPFECQKWHLNKLLTLIKVCNAESTPPDKRRKKPNISKRKALNEMRKKRFNTRG